MISLDMQRVNCTYSSSTSFSSHSASFCWILAHFQRFLARSRYSLNVSCSSLFVKSSANLQILDKQSHVDQKTLCSFSNKSKRLRWRESILRVSKSNESINEYHLIQIVVFQNIIKQRLYCKSNLCHCKFLISEFSISLHAYWCVVLVKSHKFKEY